MSSPVSMKNVSLIATFYALPKALAWLTTRPHPYRPENTMHVARSHFANVQERLARFMGNMKWNYTTEVLLDNLWISTIALFYINPSVERVRVADVVAYTISATMLVWMSRFYGAKGSSSYHRGLALWIAPRNLRERL